MRESAGRPLVLVLVLPEAVGVPSANVRNGLSAVFPALLNSCEVAVVAIERTDFARELLRETFSAFDQVPAARVCYSVHDALAYARELAPYDVLQIQHEVLRRRGRRRDHE